MNSKNIGLACKRVMTIKNISGKEFVAENIFSSSRLSRILNGKSIPDFREISLFCDYCGITMSEFSYFLNKNTEEEKMLLKYRKYIKSLSDGDETDAKEMVNYYKKKRFANLSTFLQYVRVENFIIPKLEKRAFSGLPDDCIEFIVKNVGNGELVTATELYILAGTAREVPYDFLKEIYQKVVPLQYDYIFGISADDRAAVREFISNSFDEFIDHGDLDLAKDSLNELTAYLNCFPNLRFGLNTKINENFLVLSKKLDRKIITETELYINALKNLGEDVFAKGIEAQLESMIVDKDLKLAQEKMPAD
ncbi:helix-turn-helix transcriptional regulator [Enterococcus sp. DIV0660C]|uniref:helix-turn-helix domain-containing protein n=1 Tax=Enterococcus sp. DIV0660C TaxID=2230880 RepID=UPI001A8FE546|nr:helix-turn-helix transcriptional regulator [Enterococcus sp. DIV0660C]MBO0431299.1 helix-turn-helix transcriptional regulator [Enterococcus sp. DIV0660C]